MSRSLPTAFSIGRPGTDESRFFRIYTHSAGALAVEADTRRHPGTRQRLARIVRESEDMPWPQLQVIKQIARAVGPDNSLLARLAPSPDVTGAWRLSFHLRGGGTELPVTSPGQESFLDFDAASQSLSRTWLTSQVAEAARMQSRNTIARTSDIAALAMRFKR